MMAIGAGRRRPRAAAGVAEQIAKLWGGNLLRVWREVEAIASKALAKDRDDRFQNARERNNFV